MRTRFTESKAYLPCYNIAKNKERLEALFIFAICYNLIIKQIKHSQVIKNRPQIKANTLSSLKMKKYSHSASKEIFPNMARNNKFYEAYAAYIEYFRLRFIYMGKLRLNLIIIVETHLVLFQVLPGLTKIP